MRNTARNLVRGPEYRGFIHQCRGDRAPAPGGFRCTYRVKLVIAGMTLRHNAQNHRAAANSPKLRERRRPPLRCILWLAVFCELKMTFDETLTQAVQHTIVDFIRKGEWMKLDYNARINVDSAWLRDMHSRVDMGNVMALVAGQVEQRIADGIMNSMATEIANDVKSIMCNKELREDIRATIRAKVREAEAALVDG